MKSLIFEFPIESGGFFGLKLLLFPIITLFIYFLFYTLLMQIFKNKKDGESLYARFEIRSVLFKIYAAIFCVIPINIYWFFEMRNLQNLDVFDWLDFPMGLNNIYFQLLPLILSIGLIIWLCVSNMRKIKNIL